MRSRLMLSIAAVLTTTVLGACGGSDTPKTESTTAKLTTLAEAHNQCGAGQLADDDKTLVIDTMGEEDEYGDTWEKVVCVSDQLKMPESVRSHMETTRAMDGRQEDDWGKYEAGWSYHPDDGMSLTITSSEK